MTQTAGSINLCEHGTADMNTHDLKTAADGAAVVGGVASFMQWFPPVVGLVGGLLTVIWLSIRIWETETVRNLFKRKGNTDAE